MTKLLLPALIGTAMLSAQQPAPRKAGDVAPDLDWSKVVGSPESAKYRPGFIGHYSVLRFAPNLTANARLIDPWNELVAGQPEVQFFWIASQATQKVGPFLKEHPVSGWLLIDEGDKMAATYGCELSCDVAIGPDGRIVGFTSFIVTHQIEGIVQGKAVAIAPDASDDETFAALRGGKVRLETEPRRMMTVRKPEFPPSLEVHISHSNKNGTESSSAPDHWLMRGFDLQGIAAVLYDIDASRVIVPKELERLGKFDLALVPPEPLSDRAIHDLVRPALEKELKFNAARETRPMDVYVMTALAGKTPPATPEGFGGGTIASSTYRLELPAGTPDDPEAIHKALEAMVKERGVGLSEISAHSVTLDEFCLSLERSLGRPVINQTGMQGAYDLQVRGNARNPDEFIRSLREQTGLVLTQGRQGIEYLVLHPLP